MIRFSLTALILTFLVFGFIDIDLWVQDYLFDFPNQNWLLDKNEPLTKQIFYNIPKILVIIIGLCALVGSLAGFAVPRLKAKQKAFLLIFLSILIIPALVGGLKTATNVPCPSKIDRYGGEYPAVTFLETITENIRNAIFKGHGESSPPTQRCFPAGHASGGFALLSLIFLFAETKQRRIAGTLIFIAGSSMAFYKMMIGDHYLSHTLITLWLSILIIWSMAYKLGLLRKVSR